MKSKYLNGRLVAGCSIAHHSPFMLADGTCSGQINVSVVSGCSDHLVVFISSCRWRLRLYLTPPPSHSVWSCWLGRGLTMNRMCIICIFAVLFPISRACVFLYVYILYIFLLCVWL